MRASAVTLRECEHEKAHLLPRRQSPYAHSIPLIPIYKSTTKKSLASREKRDNDDSRNQAVISGRYPKSRIELLPAREHTHDPTGLRDDVHHRLDSRRALDHPATVAFSGMMIPAAAMMIPAAAMMVIVVVWGPTIFW